MDKKLFFYIFALFVVYMMLYPKHHMISDEVYYAQQGVMFFQDKSAFEIFEWSEGNPQIRNSDIRNYKVGTGLVAGSLMAVLGNEAQYLIGIFSLLISMLAIGFTLKEMGYSSLWSSLLILSPINGLLCRTIMSDLPSMALSAVFIYLLIRNKRTIHENICAAFIVGVSYFFRETNIVLLGLLSLPFLIKKNNYKLLYLITIAITGLVFAYITTRILGEPLFTRDLGGLNFLPANFLGNLPLYVLILTIVMPLGIVFILSYKGKYNRLFKITSVIFIIVYLLYGYNGYDTSGAKGVLLNGRFMLPLLPIIIISTAACIQKSKYFSNRLLNGIAILSFSIFFLLNGIGYLHNERQNAVVDIVKENNSSIFTSDSESYLLKYANYFTGGNHQVRFSKGEIKKCLLKGETVVVLYSNSMESFKNWLDNTDNIRIENKGNVTFLDHSTLRFISLSRDIEN